MIEKEFLKLFATKNDLLIAKKDIINNEHEKLGQIGDTFYVDDIVGYGFDLVSAKNPEIKIRLLNSELKDYFELNK